MTDYITIYICVDDPPADVLAEFRRTMFSTRTVPPVPGEAGREGEVFDLAALVPIPLDVLNTDGERDWMGEHWGCMAPATATVILTDDGESFAFGFDTAWRAPARVLDLMAERFPQLSIRVITRDNATDMCAEVLYDGGERVDECCAFHIADLFDEDDTPVPKIFIRDKVEA